MVFTTVLELSRMDIVALRAGPELAALTETATVWGPPVPEVGVKLSQGWTLEGLYATLMDQAHPGFA